MLNEKSKTRLEQEPVIWMTTVKADGQPQTSVVWFLLEDDEILVYSKDGTIRNRNVLANPKVALNLNGDQGGGSVVTIEGTAHIDHGAPEPKDHSAYMEKYRARIEQSGWTPEIFGRDYPVPIRIKIEKVRAW